jgi:uncharacterized membrane protein
MNRWLVLSTVLTAVAWAGSLYLYYGDRDLLPDPVPIHWNIQGEPNGWVPWDSVLWVFLLMPGAMALITFLTVALPWLSPKAYEVSRFGGTFGYVMAMTVVLMGYLHGVILWATFHGNQTFDGARALFGGVLLFFVVIGSVMGKVRRNFWMGVRTPWTLASEAVWDRTHRLAARLFVGGGLVGLAALLAGVPVLWGLGGFFAVVFTPVVYSLVLYKRLERRGRL